MYVLPSLSAPLSYSFGKHNCRQGHIFSIVIPSRQIKYSSHSMWTAPSSLNRRLCANIGGARMLRSSKDRPRVFNKCNTQMFAAQ